jgi:hypothetical protein
VKIHSYRARSPRDYRTVGITFDTSRKWSYDGRGGRVYTLTVGLWWWDMEWFW